MSMHDPVSPRRIPPFACVLRRAYAADETTPALGIVLVACTHGMVVVVWFLFVTWMPVSGPHVLVDSIATPLLAAVFLLWLAGGWMGWLTPHTGCGFALAAHGLLARWTCSFAERMGTPLGTPVEQAPLHDLVAALRWTGSGAYVLGLSVVVASCVRDAVDRCRRPPRAGPSRGWPGRLVGAAIVLVPVVLYLLTRILPGLHRAIRSPC